VLLTRDFISLVYNKIIFDTVMAVLLKKETCRIVSLSDYCKFSFLERKSLFVAY
jgi:hypothetical protein